MSSVVSVDEEKEVIGHLKVSLEAATALIGIYSEFQQRRTPENREEAGEEDNEKQEEAEEEDNENPEEAEEEEK